MKAGCAALLACQLVLAPAAPADPAQISVAQRHVAAITHVTGPLPNQNAFNTEITAALKGRDAETTTISFLHAIGRSSARLLSDEQSRQWAALLASRQDSIRRLHDERNVLRGFFFTHAWQLPLATGSEYVAAKAQLNDWLNVWTDITLQERIAHHQLCRDAWRILSATQQAQVQAGDWDRFVRKSTGHERAYFGDRIVRRALGEPDHPEAFRTASASLAAEHETIQRQLQEMERRWRIITFGIPSAPDAWLAAEWHQTAAALKAYFLTQVSQIGTLVKAGYDIADPAVRKRITNQVSATAAELSEKVATKLTTGRDLHRKLIAAE